MKKILTIFLLVIFLTGCSGQTQQVDRAMSFREKLLKAEGCTFDVIVTADYIDSLYNFSMQCSSDNMGNLQFTVTQPQSISGITGSISADGGKLTFDDQVLAFEKMADDQISPVSAPWVFLHTLRSGYINSCSQTENGMRISIDDSYADDSLQLDIWTDENMMPQSAEIIWQGRRVLTLEVSNFIIL